MSRLNSLCTIFYSAENWLVILFIIACGIVFERAIQSPHEEYHKLHAHRKALNEKKAAALRTQNELKRQVSSQNDPAWVELILMKELGLVPEHQIKVVFEDITE